MPVSSLMPQETRISSLEVNFNDSTQPVSFEILWTCEEVSQKANITLKVTMGELIVPVSMNEEVFIKEQGEKLILIRDPQKIII